MKAPVRYRALGSLLVALASAEGAVRLLRPRGEVLSAAPVALDSYFSREQIERGRRFARPQLALGMSRSAIEFCLLARTARHPPRLPARLGGRPVAGGAAAATTLALTMSVVPLPLSALARRRAIAVGLVTQSWRGWALDLLKSTAIEAVLAAAGGAAITAAARRYPRRWWAVAAAGSVGVGAVFATLAPIALDPLFNAFTVLAEGETRSDVLELARASGVEVGEVYSVDASRRTTAANAYVTGLGPTKRVVLFDTLLERYDRDEVRVVVAHELAHVRGRDVWRGVLFAALVAPSGALAVQRLSRTFGAEHGTPAALPALVLSAALVTAPLGLIANRLMRALERRADTYSLELSRSPQAFISFERRIALQNVADLDPPRWVTALLATHPPTVERIGFAVRYLNKAGAQAPAS